MTDKSPTDTPLADDALEGQGLFQTPDIKPVEHLAATPPIAKRRDRSFWQKLKQSNTKRG
ncbi:MAG: hypothetical protein ACI30K_03975 [Muribaculaceae bacterium]